VIRGRSSGLLAGAILAGSVLLLGLALWLASGSGDEPGRDTGTRFLADMREKVNDLESIHVIAPGGERTVTLRRSADRWHVRERDDYEADFATVRGLLRALAEARIIEPRTTNPDWYPRLGVENIDAPDAGGLVLRFPDTDLPGVIVGAPDNPRGGHNVRREGEDQAWLIDRILDAEDHPVGWLERSVMDIPHGEMDKVVVRHPDGSVIQINSTGLPDTPFVLRRMPEGYQLRGSWLVTDLADGLASIRMEDVRPHDQVPSDAVRALFTTLDGLNFIASVFADDDGYWVHFRVSAESPAAGDDDELEEGNSDRLAGAVAVDARLSPWQYRITEEKFDQLTMRLEDLLISE